jgi:predicted dehydrogenase
MCLIAKEYLVSVGANGKVNVAVIGLGWPGQRHLEGYTKLPFVNVAAICDMSESLLMSTHARFPVETATTDYQSILARPDIDAVSICLPNWLHAPISIEAIGAGKHVLCEKPLANTLAEGERLTAAVHASDRIFMLALNNRFRVEIQSLKRIIDAGMLGDIYYTKTGWVRRRWAGTVRGWFMEKEKSGGGPLIDLGVHMLDLALWLMGSPKATRVSGVVYDRLAKEMEPLLGPLDIEDLGAAMVHLDNGTAIYLETSWGGYIAREHIFTELLGTRGGAKYERWGREAPTGQPIPPFQLFTTIADEQINAIPTHILLSPEEMLLASFENEMRHFAECVRDDVQPIATVDQGLEILRILDAIYRSGAEEREIALEPSRV